MEGHIMKVQTSDQISSSIQEHLETQKVSSELFWSVLQSLLHLWIYWPPVQPLATHLFLIHQLLHVHL